MTLSLRSGFCGLVFCVISSSDDEAHKRFIEMLSEEYFCLCVHDDDDDD